VLDRYASAHARLAKLMSDVEVELGRNEASTRLHMIDPLLIECLGWDVDDVEPEKYREGVYADYMIGKPYPRLVVEAKKEGVHFTLPAGITGTRWCKLSTIMESHSAADAILQVLGYAQQHGVPIAAIANGHSLVAFLASRQDGVPPLDGKALVYSSLDEMVKDFATLWTHLSRDGVLSGNLQRQLSTRDGNILPPEKLSRRISNYPGFRPRDAQETDLKTLGEMFILDIQSISEIEEDFIRECYCSSGALSQYATVSKEILRTRYTLVAEGGGVQPEPVEDKKGLNERLTRDVLANALHNRPIILLGDVGVGKSMFLQRLIKIEAKEILQDVIVLYVNFGAEPALANDINDYVTEKFIDELAESYNIDIYDNSLVRAIYKKDLKRFENGIYGSLRTSDPDEYKRQELRTLQQSIDNTSEHLRRAMKFLQGSRHKYFLVVLDNVDQRPTEFQEQVFLISQSLAQQWPATVFVALRPSTFYESKSSGSLAAYQPRVFTVAPARIDDVLLLRLKFARKQLVETGKLQSFPKGLTLDSTSLVSYMDVLIKAFQEDDRLKELLDNMSGGNIRQALGFVATFVGSGYVRTKRILSIAAEGGTYNVPMHEFIRAIMYGDQEYYDASKSPILNVFDISRSDGREHFLLLAILNLVQRLGQTAGQKGYVSGEILYQRLHELGFDAGQVENQMTRAISGKLIDDSPDGIAASFRIRTVGAYMCQKMPTWFAYVDAVVIDTPVVDLAARREIEDVQGVIDRLNRGELFRKYLDTQWLSAEIGTDVIDWPSLSSALQRDIDHARSRANRPPRTSNFRPS
jgi:hypothetical protein